MFNTLLVLALSLASLAIANPDAKAKTAHELAEGNHQVRLVAAWRSETRAQNLVASFAVENEGDGHLITIDFPAHSHTPHEITLMAIINACVDWSDPDDVYKPHQATCAVIFSIPKDSIGRRTNFEEWWLESLKREKAHADK